MAVEIEKLIAEKLGQLPKGHSDRKFLARQLTIFEAFNARPDGSKDTPLPQGDRIEVAPKPDLRQETYKLLFKVREPSIEERETLTKRGFVFLPVEAKTLAQVVSENLDHFWSGELEYINGLFYPDLRDYVPPVMEVAFNPTQLFIPNTFSKSLAQQLQTTEEYSQRNIEGEFPDAKVLMLPASVLAQADIVYSKTGQVLFRNRFARALDRTAGSSVVPVGRFGPAYRLGLGGRGSGVDRVDVGVPLAVVFLQK